MKLLFLLLITALCSEFPLLHFKFRDSANIVVNKGSKYEDRDTIEWIGGPRDIGSDDYVVLSNKNNFLFKSPSPLKSVGKFIFNSEGFEVNLNVSLPFQYNHGGEMCLFCLSRNPRVSIDSFDLCRDMDLAIIWRENYMTFFSRNSLTDEKCNHTRIDSFISPRDTRNIVNFRFRFTPLLREIYHGNRRSVVVPSKKEQKISNWAGDQYLWIGSKKTSKSFSSVELYNVALFGAKEQVKTVHPEMDLPSKNYVKKVLRYTDSRGLLNEHTKSLLNKKTGKDVKLGKWSGSGYVIEVKSTEDTPPPCKKRDRCDICNGNGGSCPEINVASQLEKYIIMDNVKCSISKEVDNIEVNNSTDLFRTQFTISTSTVVFNTKQIYGYQFMCKSGNISPSWILNKVIDEGSHRIVVEATKIDLSQLYECFTGKKSTYSKDLQSELEHISGKLQIKVLYSGDVVYNVPCSLDIGLSFVGKDKSGLNFHGSSVVTQGSTSNNPVVTSEINRYTLSREKDGVFVFKTCYNRFIGLENSSTILEDINIVNGDGTKLTVSDISPCTEFIHDESSFCCHTWHLVTTDNHFLNNQKITSNVNVQHSFKSYKNDINISLKGIWNQPVNLPSVVIPSLQTQSSTPKWKAIICMFNNKEMTRSYYKYNKNQQVFFKIDLVRESEFPTRHCTDQKCGMPELTLHVSELGICHYLNDKKDITDHCEFNGGSYTRLIVKSDDFINHDYRPTLSVNTSCSSRIIGSFVDRSTEFDLYTHPYKLSPGLYVTETKKFNEFSGMTYYRKQTDFSQNKVSYFTSSSSVGGCPLGLYYSDYFQDCVQLPYWYLGWSWVTFKWAIIVIFIGGVLGLGYYFCVHSKHRKRVKLHHQRMEAHRLSQRQEDEEPNPYKE